MSNRTDIMNLNNFDNNPGKIFNILNKVKCDLDKKGRFNYVSWTDAWSEIMKVYPTTTFKVYETEAGFPAFIKPKIGGFVKIGVTIEGLEHIEHYPILDNYNKPIIENITVWDINNAIKRGMVKCLAYFGLGLYVYKGEDLPEEEEK